MNTLAFRLPLMTENVCEQIKAWLLAPTSSQRLVLRGRIVLLLADGLSDSEVARRTGRSRATIARWRTRVQEDGIANLASDRAGRGRKTYKLTPEKIKEIVDTTLFEESPGKRRWTLRSMARRAGVAPSSVYTVWKSHQLKPCPKDTAK